MKTADFPKAFSKVAISMYRPDIKQLRVDFKTAPDHKPNAICAELENPVAQKVYVHSDTMNSRFWYGQESC
jgi:hypothetical protein